jgi:hypothetical protein
MKKLIFLIIPLLMLFIFSCTKELQEKGYMPGSGDVSTFKAARGSVIQVLPSGGDDTYEIIAAFNDAKASGSGSTVQLVEGEYHIGFVLVEDFIGSFNGAGIGKTIIIPNMDLPYLDLYAQNLAPELVKFLRGNVRISNMSFLNLEGEPCTGDDLWAFLGLHDWADNELPDLPENHKITAMVDHVEFVSNPGPAGWTPYAVQTAVVGGPDFLWDYNLPYSNTDITVTNCTVREMSWAFSNLGIDKGRTILSNNGPLYTDGGIVLSDNLGGSTLISDNEFFTPAWGNAINITDANYLSYNLFEFKLSDGCQYEISGNIIHAVDSWGAITIADDRKAAGVIDNKNPVQVLVKSNQFDLQGEVWVGIWNWITDDAVIRNNKFTGQAKTGLYIDPRTTNSLMLGNNFSNLVCSKLELWEPLIFGEGYKIILCGNNNSVVGGSDNSTTVLNLGENNKITGAKFANEGKDPLGQTISDNYRIWKENLVKIRKH